MKNIFIVLILLAVAILLYFSQNKKETAEDISINYTEGLSESMSVFGEPALGDLDGDGDEDVALYLVESSEGSGTFYYGVFSLNNGDGTFSPTETIFLGDRIAPQNIQIEDGKAIYNFVDRAPNEPMTTAPSVGKSIWVIYNKNTGDLGELVKNFEGEANPDMMTLDMKKWEWVLLEQNDGTKITPKDSSRFVIEFKNDGTFSASTDCNGVGGEYTTKDNQITFSQMMSTLMYCEGSQEDEFRKILENTSSYFFTSKGELKFELKFDSGVATFR